MPERLRNDEHGPTCRLLRLWVWASGAKGITTSDEIWNEDFIYLGIARCCTYIVLVEKALIP